MSRGHALMTILARPPIFPVRTATTHSSCCRTLNKFNPIGAKIEMAVPVGPKPNDLVDKIELQNAPIDYPFYLNRGRWERSRAANTLFALSGKMLRSALKQVGGRMTNRTALHAGEKFAVPLWRSRHNIMEHQPHPPGRKLLARNEFGT